MKTKNKLIVITLIMIIILQNIATLCYAATEISSAALKNDHSIANTHLQFRKNGVLVDIRCNYICYNNNNKKYPAYCINHGLNGVDEEGDYTVNISKVLSDEKVWKTIINGYPYVSAKDLGLGENENDLAYFVTKQAVFSVMEDRDVDSFYTAKDNKGKDIKTAIKNLANKWKTEKRTYNEANINLNKIGNINKLNENYYYIQYEVKANTNIKEYTIKDESNLPKGAYTTDVNNNQKTDFQSNENFRLVIPKEEFKKDIKGDIILQSKCETYPIYYGESPKSNTQNYAITYEKYETFENKFDINEKTNNSNIKIIKKDEESLKPIEGITFHLIKDGSLLDRKQTDKNGMIEFKNLYPGKYILRETDAGRDYILKEEDIEINLEYSQTQEKTITNKHKKGRIKNIESRCR